MPIVATSEALIFAEDNTDFEVLMTVSNISLASCSTQPDFGKICLNSFWEASIILNFESKIILREEVVP